MPISNKDETVDEALTTPETGEFILPYVVGHNKVGCSNVAHDMSVRYHPLGDENGKHWLRRATAKRLRAHGLRRLRSRTA